MRAKKRYGQHFLQRAWAEKLVDAIAPEAGDHFLEIGPGPGALTLPLAARVAHLTAIEIDSELAALLRPQVPANVRLVEGDILEADLDALFGDRPTRVAGNLPYNVCSPILFKLLDMHRRSGLIPDATLMLQREVADRLEAVPGTKDYGVLSILFQLHADVRRVLSLPPGAFRPAPKVHSAVVRLSFRAPAVAVADERVFEQMVRSMFTKRRKTLSNALSDFAEANGRSSVDALRSAEVNGSRRAETLQLAEIARLADYFASTKSRAVL